MIPGRSVLWLGLAQLISWGITYYPIQRLGDAGALGMSLAAAGLLLAAAVALRLGFRGRA